MRPRSLALLLQDAPLSDCTDTIDGLDVSEGSYSPAKSIRKVPTALVTNSIHLYFTTPSSHSSQPADRSLISGHIQKTNSFVVE